MPEVTVSFNDVSLNDGSLNDPSVGDERLDIHLLDEGEGEPVVLIGGLTSTFEVWQYQIDGLKDSYRVLAPDNRGSGRTREHSDDGLRSIPRFARDVLSLLDALELDRVHLVGASMGGMIVQQFAISWPERLRTLTIACSHHGGSAVVPAAPEAVAALVAGGAGNATEEQVRASHLAVFHERTLRERPEAVRFYQETKDALPHTAEEVAARIQGIQNFDVESRLSRVAVPTLVLTGDADRLVPPENSSRIASLIPDAELVVLEDCAHGFFCERPGAFNDALRSFLERHPMGA